MGPREILKESVLLYAEDEPIVSEQMLPIFRQMFRNVEMAEDGERAYAAFLEGGIHIVVADISMPKMNGLELIRKIREHDRKMPIVITTSHDDNAYLKEAVSLYLVDYLVKPFKLDALKSALEKSARQLLEEGRAVQSFGNGTEYNLLRRELFRNGETLVLTLKEQHFLELMIRNRNRLVTKELVEYEVWGGEEMSEAALKNFLTRLRKKIGKDTIRTVQETGFLLNKHHV
jgi:two-component system, OmpR family, response regulator VanR